MSGRVRRLGTGASQESLSPLNDHTALGSRASHKHMGSVAVLHLCHPTGMLVRGARRGSSTEPAHINVHTSHDKAPSWVR
eukprot:jgi/Chlat1/8821/Chrsp91S08162